MTLKTKLKMKTTHISSMKKKHQSVMQKSYGSATVEAIVETP